ncbi:tyrosine-protein phosphatase non-receptor type substrate 1-like [Protopterus annectens]|uniref:tyrosine-protein phosphatase non-receptor type substrate 1-like n=1 Tax=Protopterus annectens TaxID=7888 RepID=UPI001CFBF2DF|nr:tyrosine-protein phosphatase non-receptor type substrate 1-like [Protopterus annectens]
MQDQIYEFSLIFTVTLLSTFKGTSGLTIYQSPSVTGREGDTVILNCTLSVVGLGPVRWYKGDNQQQLMYSQLTSDKPDPRVMIAVQDNATRNIDHSIRFTNITWDDAGMYYCVKFKSDKVNVSAAGNGTQLYVTRQPFHPVVFGPSGQVLIDTNVTLSCNSAGFSPPNITVTWWQNNREIQGSKSEVNFSDKNNTYQVQSNITVQAKIDSPVICRINHTALGQPIESNYTIINIVKRKFYVLFWYYK